MVNLTTSYECKVDTKGRLMLPNGLKKELAGVLEEGFILKRSVFYQCLEMYPRQEWDKELAFINKLNRFKKKNVDFIHRYMAGVKPAELDNSGRIQIPKNLAVFADISKNIVIAPQINKVEIWDKDLYEQAISDEAIDFAALTEEVMGDQENDLI